MSLDSMEVLMRIERDFDVDIPDPTAERLETVEAVVAFLHQELAKRRQSDSKARSWSEKELLDALRDIIVDEVGVARHRITPQAHFRKDLGIE